VSEHHKMTKQKLQHILEGTLVYSITHDLYILPHHVAAVWLAFIWLLTHCLKLLEGGTEIEGETKKK